VTIKDIAKLAGVTHSTVSRSLNDSPLVSEETKERIKKIAREIGYAPNRHAQRLVTKKSRTLGVFYLSRDDLDFMENFGTQFLSGITQACHARNYDLLLFTTPRDLSARNSYLSLCRERHVEGVVFIGLTSDDPHIAEIASSDIPVSAIDYELPGKNVVTVTTDSGKGVGMAVDWLRAMGHRRIAFIEGPLQSQIAQERARVFRETAGRLGIYDPSLVFRGDFSKRSGYERALDAMRASPMPGALFASNDAMALGAMKAFKEHGLRVPVDVSVMGYDNAQACEYSDPGLSTIAQDAQAMGERAVEAVFDRIDGKGSPPLILVEPRLIERESVRRLPPPPSGSGDAAS
jgi:LacI family transcriptional regulator